MLRKHEIVEANEMISAYAEMMAPCRDVWYRVAKIENGIELDLGDDQQTRIRITPGDVQSIHSGSGTLFYRTSFTQPFAAPAAHGDLSRIRQYLNMDDAAKTLFLAWVAYTIAHPKAGGTAYVILVIKGD